MKRLLISNFAGNRLLVNESGEPVWPVNVRQEQALRRLAEVFGGSLEKVVGMEATIDDRGAEEVVACGPDLVDPARLYAHLTGRQFRIVASLQELWDRPLPAVVVMWQDELTHLFLQRLSRACSGTATGVICSDTAENLLLQVLLRAAAARLCGDTDVARVDLNILLPIGSQATPARRMLGAKALPSDIRAALNARAGVLSLYTHSDGLDASLGPDLTLCPMKDPPISANTEKSPRCQLSSICYRRNLMISDAVRSSELVSPHEISARIMVWNSCQGILLPEGLVDPRWGLAPQLLASDTLGALVLTWDVLLLDSHHAGLLADYLEQGVPVGRALGVFLNLPRSRSLGYEMCLFGDPRVLARPCPQIDAVRSCSEQSEMQSVSGVAVDSRGKERARGFQTRNRVSSRPSGNASSLPSAYEPRADRGDVDLLKACLMGAAKDAKGYSSLALRALHMLQKCESPAWTERRSKLDLSGTRSDLGSETRKAICEYLLARGGLFEDWAGYSSWEGAADANRPCAVCGLPLRSFVASLCIPGVSRRRLTVCPCCQVVEDAPVESGITLAIVGGKSLRLLGRLPTSNWTALLLLNSWGIEAVSEWPAAQNCLPVELFEPASTLPPRQVDVSLFLLWQYQVVILKARTIGAGKLEQYVGAARNTAAQPTHSHGCPEAGPRQLYEYYPLPKEIEGPG
jgi:hypothetical protein